MAADPSYLPRKRRPKSMTARKAPSPAVLISGGTATAGNYVSVDYLALTRGRSKSEDLEENALFFCRFLNSIIESDTPYPVWKKVSPRYRYTEAYSLFENGQLLATVMWRAHYGYTWVDLKGTFCQIAQEAGTWTRLVAFFEEKGFLPTRCDIALDVIEGFPFERIIDALHNGEFDQKGPRPTSSIAGDWDTPGSPKGRTIYVGSRKTEKYLRFYEKGKQLGDIESQWIRSELVLRKTNKRGIKWEAVKRPKDSLYSSVPFLRPFISDANDDLKPLYSLKHDTDDGIRLLALRNSYGKFVRYLRDEKGWDDSKIVDSIVQEKNTKDS